MKVALETLVSKVNQSWKLGQSNLWSSLTTVKGTWPSPSMVPGGQFGENRSYRAA